MKLGLHSVIFFDEHCKLCLNSLRIVRYLDRAENFLFSPLNGKMAAVELSSMGDKKTKNCGSVVVKSSKGKLLTEAEAIFFIITNLQPAFRFVSVLKFIPLSFWDRIYRFVAAIRYSVFGRTNSLNYKNWKQFRE